MSMMSIFKKKSFYIVLILVMAVVGYSIYVKIMNDRFDSRGGEEASVNAAESKGDIGREDTYTAYLENHKDAIRPEGQIAVDVLNYSSADQAEKYEEFEGKKNVLVSQEGGFVEWTVTVPEAGLYNISFDYFPIKAKGIDIERALYINGEVPFRGADNLAFTRVWANNGEKRVDNRGNEIRPSQMEAPKWQSTYIKDYLGYVVEPYLFYFEQGENVIRLEATNEPFAITNLVVGQKTELANYQDYISNVDLNAYQNTDMNFNNKIQGEDAVFRSSPTLYAIFDRASSNTEPYSAAKIKLNAIGGAAWRVAGQWIEWEAEVPEDGLYNISFKARQNYNRGVVSSRNLTIDGVTPFEEAAALEFRYSTGWDLTTLTDAEGNPCQVPLTKGKHLIRLEVTLGDLGNILGQIEDSVNRLNAIYRKMLVVTGSKPDPYRDYHIDQVYPDVMVAMEQETQYLDSIISQMKELTGQKGSEAAVADNISAQLKRFIKNPDVIPRSMEGFRLNISALGTTILNLSNSQLDVDYIYINAAGAKLPKVKETFFGKVAHELKSFTASFFEDYTTVGNVYTGETIDVWLISGRDQATILKNMLDESFTPETGIGVNVKLVDPGTLLPAVVAGTGPDIALTVDNGIPVDYALRDAAVDLTQFEDFDEVASEYYDSAFVPYEFNGGIYGLPETQIFNVLYYRKDILEGELGLKIPEDLPQTWDDVIALMPVLNKKNLQFALPSTDREINGAKSPDPSGMVSMMFQAGAELYNEDQTKALLDDEKSVTAFEKYTQFFTHYGSPLIYDFVNRFRSGEMPIGVADYNWYNVLSVFAPEIRGEWDFALLPGTLKPDGTIDRSVSCYGQASIMLKDAENYDACWKFLKWWASSDVKVRYARELESIMGAAARYATANKVTFEQLSWSNENAAVLEEQWKWVKGTPVVAGGYSTIRHMINAFRKVAYAKEDARETLLDYTRTINEEITYKRKELGLD